MAAATEKTILVKGSATEVRVEGTLTAVAVTPGALLERTSTADQFQAHSSADAPHQSMFAVEDELQGNEIGDNYAASARVQVHIAQRGDVVNALLANGEVTVIGDVMISNGDGNLKVLDTDSSANATTEHPVGVVLNVLDFSDSSLADPTSNRILVEIM